MSARICGKRVGFEELFGSSSKRFRCSSSDPGSRPDDPVSTFSALDHELITSVVRNHDNSDTDERNKQHNFDIVRTGNCTDDTATCSQISGYNVECNGNAVDSPKWTDLFVQEMSSAASIDDAKARAARILEAFEGSVVANKRAAEEIKHASLKEHLRSLLDNNQILRRSVAIQHERNVEQEGKETEVQHLKLKLNQCIEQARTLELNNYTLRLHLQRTQQSSSINGQLPPDIF
ncbi:uncharacterized protein LOC120214161 isoform X1 [Hibiscus syriacus]|uniref:uncharacterized protein LOC120214161 isoform X1 n=1 Tax=Hibiscus syriacus TaxID=106335 RepID=UPI001924FEB2|nr:uncharacterized protein LOC120214161 isoform X1 [Hibiscus syriacus]